MALVYIDDLLEGMVLAEDLLTPSGRFVLAAGASIKADQLKLLKSWGVVEAHIEDAGLNQEGEQQASAGEEHASRVESFLSERFALNDLEQEPIATLFRHVTRRLSIKCQKGLDLKALPVSGGTDDVSDVPAPLTVNQLLKGAVELVSLPTVYSHIVELLSRSNTSSHHLARVIDKDANLSVRLLRLANSSFYGFSGKVDSVSRAISLLGNNELTHLVLGISVIRQFRNIPSEQIDMESFWRHSIRCGLFARILAEQLGEKDSEKYFTGGLLHDIGRLVMLDRMPLQYACAVNLARHDKLPMYRAEQDCLKTDHSIIGKLLAEKWRLSPTLIRMIGHHHSPRLAHFAKEACLVHIADVFAHACSEEILLIKEVPELYLQAWVETGLSPEMIAPAIQKVDNEFRQIVAIFFDEAGSGDKL
ncbi:MAG: HDOD domain-containing protein [Desulfuromonadales bacterium]|nr:HDOD domain-containing protein [Desulfuromonadales bacterium]MBN2791805.1 HDOD domain-containing protein [Desulfuromonadales bacterium]